MVVLGGNVMEYGFAMAYTLAGALLGAPPGQEFKAALVASNQARGITRFFPGRVCMCCYAAGQHQKFEPKLKQ